jgi:hypothetical protein
VKNTSITPEEINGRNTTKYGTGSRLKNYYDSIWEGIE